MGVRIGSCTNGKLSSLGTRKVAYDGIGWYYRGMPIPSWKFNLNKSYKIIYYEGLGDWN